MPAAPPVAKDDSDWVNVPWPASKASSDDSEWIDVPWPAKHTGASRPDPDEWIKQQQTPKELSFGEKAMEFGKGVVKGALKTGEGFGDITSFGLNRAIRRRVNPEGFKQEQEMLTPHNAVQRAGFSTEKAAEFLAPIPGLQEVRAAEGAGLGTRLLFGALREGADVGLKTAVQTGDVGEAAKGAATGAVLGGASDALLRPVASLLGTWARQQYGKVLHPLGRSAKEVTEEKLLSGGANDLVSRRVAAPTQNKLIEKLSRKAEQAGNNVEAAINNLSPAAKTKLQPVFNDIHNFLRDEAMLPNGKIGRPALYAEGLQMMDRISNAIGDRFADVDPKTVRAFRQILDKELYAKKLAINPTTDEDVVKAFAANSIRDALNKQHPTIAAVNKEYEFWTKAQQVLTLKRTNEVGQYRFSKHVGALGRAGIGAAILGTEEGARGRSPEHALLGAALGASLGSAIESTAWRTVSPIVKNQVARLLVSGKGQQAADLAIRVVGRIRQQGPGAGDQAQAAAR